MRILVDLDDTLADYGGGFLAQWQKLYPERLAIPPEERPAYALHEGYPLEYAADINAICKAPTFIRDLLPLKGAVEGINLLQDHQHDVWICSAPFVVYENCLLEKYQWVEKYLGAKMVEKTILTRDKTLIRGDVLIDDKPIITGCMEPTWERIVFDTPYNKQSPGRRITWENVIEVLGTA